MYRSGLLMATVFLGGAVVSGAGEDARRQVHEHNAASEPGGTALAVDGSDWLLTLAAVHPSARQGHAMAYDSTRGRVVLYGGFDAETWEWDAIAWGRRAPATSPPARSGSAYAMAYDSARGVMVLFGGWDLAETWEWDGITWIKRTPATNPAPRYAHAMAFDSARGRVVLFGGTSGTTYYADTWEWDGNNWIERITASPPASPVPRHYHTMAYDGVRERTVLFGGLTCPQAPACQRLRDTWEWDGTTWLNRTPATGSPVGSKHGMAYDPVRQRVVMFGGEEGTLVYSYTWEWDGNAWVRREPATRPPPRRDCRLVFDSARGRVVLFGGQGASAGPFGFGSLLDDTWEWDGNTWVERRYVSPPDGDYRMAYDSARDKLVLFGAARLREAETWEGDGSAWIRRTSPTSPLGRIGHALAYDSARARVVLFGGLDTDYRNDTWEWDGSAWVERLPATRPPARFDHALAYDSTRERVMLFGGHGLSPNYQLGDTWEWDGSTWVQHTPASSPPAGDGHALAYDSARARVVLFGGRGATYLDDTWLWDGSNWDARTPATSPSIRHSHGMAYDEARGRVLLFGGILGNTAYADTWQWDGSTWLLETPATSPPRGDGQALAYDSSRERVVLFSRGETWVYGPVSACRHAASVVAFAPGSGTDDTTATDALGPPDGQAVSLGVGGSLVLEIVPPVPYGPGADFTIHEKGSIAGGAIDEPFRVEVSSDGVDFEELQDCVGGDCQIDTAGTGFTSVRYVRLRDRSPGNGEPAPESGADIEGVSVFACDELCNGVDDDRDGIVPTEETDPDGDRFVACAAWSGSNPAILGGSDCDADDARTYPGAPERCDGRDNNCDGVVAPSKADPDRDGVGACEDCDNTRASVYPGAPQICDGRNNDCRHPSWPVPPPDETDGDGDAYTGCQGDCNDGDGAIGPASLETCNGIDDNCNDLVDDDELGEDTDGDGIHNACDCAPTVPPVDEPVIVASKTTQHPTVIRLEWSWPLGAEVFNVVRGQTYSLQASDYGVCFAPALAAQSIEDPELPVAGTAWTYLVQSISGACGAGSLGQCWDGAERVNVNPGRCP